MPTQYDLKLLNTNTSNTATDVSASLYTPGGATVAKNMFVGGSLAFKSLQSTEACFQLTGTTLTLDTHYMVEASNADATTITLPKASDHPGRLYLVVKTSSSSNAVTVATTSGDYIDNASTTSLSLSLPFDRTLLLSNGIGRWYTL